jgi:hypothetical protein
MAVVACFFLGFFLVRRARTSKPFAFPREGTDMEIRGERECKDCGTHWSYFDTGSIACPDCGSLHSVGTGDRARHTDGHTDLELVDLVVQIDDTPLEDLIDEIEDRCRSYLTTRGFIRGGELKPLDDAYLVASELRQAADVFGRLRDPTDEERLYVLSLLRATDSGERPPSDDVPDRMRPARGLAAADAALTYRSEVNQLPEEPRAAAGSLLSALRDRAKRVRALEGDIDPEEADRLVAAIREIGRAIITGDDDALTQAQSKLEATE